jgi:hypothetical protein
MEYLERTRGQKTLLLVNFFIIPGVLTRRKNYEDNVVNKDFNCCLNFLR